LVPPLIITQREIDRLLEVLSQIFGQHADTGTSSH
jgi:4-aminobutyrate aminotransferase-like enzyme